MQIEFFGCSSAGKSRLLNRILQAHSQSLPAVVSSSDFVLQYVRLAWLTGTLRVIVLNLFSVSMCLLAWHKHRVFLRHVVNCVRQRRHHAALLERLRILRIALRNVGLFEFVERYAANDEIVVTDEGMLQIAHYLFVNVAVEPRRADIELFATLVPLPAVVVYLSQTESLLVKRTVRRGHKRIPPYSSELVKKFIARAVTTFEILIQQPAIRRKLLTIDGKQQTLSSVSLPMDGKLERAYNLIRPALSAQ